MLQNSSGARVRAETVPDTCITLHSGRLFDFAAPESNEIALEDIAHGLAHTCRYAGQCDGFYSVAEHCVHVSRVVPSARLAGLFHDAAEAFMGDVSAPLKRLLPEYRAIERRVERAVFEWFGIEWPLPAEVKHADLSVMAAELQLLMPPGTNAWLQDMDIAPARVKIVRLAPDRAKALFLDRYTELRGGR